MFKNFSYLLYKFLKVINYIFEKILRRSFFLWFKEFIHEDSYDIIEIKKKKIKFFVPNQLTSYRVQTFFTKEPETLNWIDNFDKNKKIVFWDVGANIGLYSIYATVKKKNVKVFAFEPSTSNLRVLSRNISINMLQEKVSINQFPLTKNEKGFNIMLESKFQEGGALHSFGINKNFEGKSFNPKNKYKIYGFSMDYLVYNLNFDVPNYIKMDVDGLEHNILEGATKVLKNDKMKSILVEINENYTEQEEKVKLIMNNNNFILKKKDRSKHIRYSKEFEKSFNYIFVR